MSQPMVKCNGCGFNVEQEDVVQMTEYSETHCDKCKTCQANPLMQESYRRGFNAGLDAMAEAVKQIASQSNLRKWKT